MQFMIAIGLPERTKGEVIAKACATRPIRQIIALSPVRFQPSFLCPIPIEWIDWAEITTYKVFYRLMQTIDTSTLLVVNECLRAQNRHELAYNCIRNFTYQTPHVLVFQHLPIIDSVDDVMILVDFATRSRWKRAPFDPAMVRDLEIRNEHSALSIAPLEVPITERIRSAYAKEKAALLQEVKDGPDKDPHLIPRNLLLVSGRAKLPAVRSNQAYVGRNNRFKLTNLATYREISIPCEHTVFELPPNAIDLADMLAVTHQSHVDALVADTKTERWYFDRYKAWVARVNDAAAAFHG